MKKTDVFLVAAALVGAVWGCDGLLTIGRPSASVLTLRFVSMSEDFDVSVDLFTSEEDDIPAEILTNDNLNVSGFTSFIVPAGQIIEIPRSCADVRAVAIGDAKLEIFGPINPDDDTRALRDGEDFECGDTITYTFAHSETLVDFRVTTVVTSPEQDSGNGGGSVWGGVLQERDQ